jgi:hypothetical protein
MRTTLTIADRIARHLKQIAHRSGKPFKVVVNETLKPCWRPVRSGPNRSDTEFAQSRSAGSRRRQSPGTAGNLTSDAHLAAHALEGGWTLVTAIMTSAASAV